MAVILNHTGFELFRGGFVGVDIFFVISGFLITGILRDEMAKGTFSIVTFYERRARRILPALFVMLLITLPLAWYVMLPEDLRNFGQSLVATNLFLSNVHFMNENGYTDVASAFKPLLHTWSLAVEEQYYIFFPPAFYLVSRFMPQRRMAIMLGFLVLSLIICVIGARYFPNPNFYLLPTRAWELLAGAALALAPLNAKIGKWGQVLSLLGFTALCASILLMASAATWPNLWTVVPVLGTVLVIAFARPGTFVHGILSYPLCVGIGLVSYSAYLWHQPVFVFSRLYYATDIPMAGYVCLTAVTLGLAYLSWRYIENPFRNRTFLRRRDLFAGAALFGALFVAAGLLLHFGNGFPNRFSGEARTIASGANEISPYWNECDAKMPENFNNFCVFGDKRAREVAVIGDSHSMEIFWKMSDSLADRPYALQAFAWHGCPPFSDPALDASKGCGQFRDKAKAYILDNARIGTVVFLANLPAYFDCTLKKPCLGSYAHGASYVRDRGGADGTTLMDRDIDAYIAAGKKVIIMYPIPEMKWNVPWYMMSRLRFSQSLDKTVVSFGRHEARAQKAIAFIDAENRKPSVTTVDPADTLCSQGAKARCTGQIDGVPLYYDKGHLNGTGAGLVAGQILTELDRQAQNSK